MQTIAKRTALAALIATAITGCAAPVSEPEASGDQASPDDRGSEVIEARAPSLHPEGVDYDAERDGFVVSSLHHGTVSVVDMDGIVTTLVEDPELLSTIGVRVDPERDRLLVVNSDNGSSVRTGPETAGQTAGLGIYDLHTGERIDYIDLAALTPNAAGHFGNDIALTGEGTAYVTDSAAGAVYAVEPDGDASVLVEDERLVYPDGTGANGIVHRDGRLIVGNYSAGELWTLKVDEPGELLQVTTDADLTGVDGLVLTADDSLIAVTNALGGNGTDAVTQLRLSEEWAQASVVDRETSPESATTAAVRDQDVWALSGDLGTLISGTGTTDEFTLRRF